MLLPLLLFTLGGTAVTLVGEAYKTHLIGYMRFADFVDLVILAPLYLYSLLALHDQFLQARESRRLRWMFLGLAFVFLYGHAMHVTANAIDTFSTEIRDYGSILPQDTYALIYFLDETLSHLIVFPTRYGLIGCLVVLEARSPRPIGATRAPQLAAGSGIVFGLWEAVVFTEGQKVWLIPIVVAGLALFWIWGWKTSKATLSTYLRRGPATFFTAGLLPAMLAGLVIYALAVGGFTEPSELGGGIILGRI
jgi:hypothetical protein